MSSTGDVAVQIRAAFALLNANPSLGQAQQQSAEAAEMFTRTVGGTTNATAKAAAALLASVPDLLDEVAAAIGQGNQAARDYLSAIGASGGTAVVGNQVVDPDERAGAKTLDTNDAGGDEPSPDRPRRKRRSLAERINGLVDKSFEAAEEVGDGIKTGTEDLQRGLSRPPDHAHGRAITGVQATPPPVEQVSAPDAVQAISVVGIAAAQAIRWAVTHSRERRKGHDDHADD